MANFEEVWKDNERLVATTRELQTTIQQLRAQIEIKENHEREAPATPRRATALDALTDRLRAKDEELRTAREHIQELRSRAFRQPFDDDDDDDGEEERGEGRLVPSTPTPNVTVPSLKLPAVPRTPRDGPMSGRQTPRTPQGMHDSPMSGRQTPRSIATTTPRKTYADLDKKIADLEARAASLEEENKSLRAANGQLSRKCTEQSRHQARHAENTVPDHVQFPPVVNPVIESLDDTIDWLARQYISDDR